MGRHAVLIAGVVAAIAIAIASATQRSAPPLEPLTISQTEALVKAHVADAVNGVAGDVQVLARSEKRFTSEELACQDPAPGAVPSVDGYAFTMQHGRTQLEYRADRAGNLRPCRVVAPVNP